MPLPSVELFKVFAGRLPIAQKSLSRLNERIENARDTIFIKDKDIPYERILIIDDALGSGATINEVARKLKQISNAKIYAYVIVGSYEGFEVVREV